MKTKKSEMKFEEVGLGWYYIVSAKVKRTMHYVVEVHQIGDRWKLSTVTDRDSAQHLTAAQVSKVKKAVAYIGLDWELDIAKFPRKKHKPFQGWDFKILPNGEVIREAVG